MKIERVYREILFQLLENGVSEFTQKDISKRCNLSTSTVNHALKPLVKMYAVKVNRRNFEVLNPKKILVYWACIRNLKRDIIFSTFLPMSVEKIETLLPHNAIPTAYTAFKLKFKKIPSDYAEVIVYGSRDEFIKRFGKEEKLQKSNLVVLRRDEHLCKFKNTPIAQIFVDIWNLGEWYANEFLKALEVEINGILARLGYR